MFGSSVGDQGAGDRGRAGDDLVEVAAGEDEGGHRRRRAMPDARRPRRRRVGPASGSIDRSSACVDAEQHDHEQEQHDDGAGVDDHLHGGEEVGARGRRRARRCRRSWRPGTGRSAPGCAWRHADGAAEHDDRGDREDEDVDHQWCPRALVGTASASCPCVARRGSLGPARRCPPRPRRPGRPRGSFTPKPSSPDHATSPTWSALPDGAVARTHAEVSRTTSSTSDQSSHGSCWGGRRRRRAARPSCRWRRPGW